MNRLSPLVVRRVAAPARAILVPRPQPFAGAEPERWLDDLKLFATGWAGGLVFFGTLLS